MIVAFLLMSIAISSCLNSDEVTEYSADATIHTFSLDTIHGVDYTFEIDQLNNFIYNPDSLPMDADTIIDSIKVAQLSVMWGVTSGDTTFSTEQYHNLLPAMNATMDKGVKLTSHALDGITTRTYTLQIRVHRQDPDSLTWVHMDTIGNVFTQAINEGEQKAIAWQGEVLLYVSPNEMYRTSGAPENYGWTRADVTGLPDEADVTSLVSFAGRLYMLADGDVYASDATGTTWEKATGLSGNVQSLVAGLSADAVTNQEAALVGIRPNAQGEPVFCTTTDGETWVAGDAVPEGFPTHHIYQANYVTGQGVRQTIVVGMPAMNAEKTIPWFTNDGEKWASLETNVTGVSCPAMTNPFIMYYGDRFYAFGGQMNAAYRSDAGIAWHQMEEKFLLPAAFAGKQSYTIAVDPTPDNAVSAKEKRDFIWVIFGGNGTPNEVWRGRLNKLGFERE